MLPLSLLMAAQGHLMDLGYVKDDLRTHSTFTWGKRSRKKMLKLAMVVKAQEQVVVGTLHHLTLEIDDAEGKKRYLAKIWVKPWENFKELQEFNYILYPDHDVQKEELKLKDFHIVNEAEVLAGQIKSLLICHSDFVDFAGLVDSVIGSLKWDFPLVNRQPKDWECGYYIMK
ncbi:cystatin B [Tanacetum coccineum]